MTKPNILSISIDDLNNFIGCLTRQTNGIQRGYPGVITPNLDDLASRGTNFRDAHCVVALCNPARTGVLCGVPSWESGVYLNHDNWKQSARLSGKDSLPGHLKANGFATYGCGKVYHGPAQIKASEWTEPYFYPPNYADRTTDRDHFVSRYAQNANKETQDDWGVSETTDCMDADIETIDHAIAKIASQEWADGGVALFAGIARPHLPYVVGQEYFDLYADFIASKPNGMAPMPPSVLDGTHTLEAQEQDQADLPERAIENLRENLGKKAQEFDEYRDLILAYLASVSFADAQVGRLLAALDANGGLSNTYVLLWTDHGQFMGERKGFKKDGLWSQGLNTPYMIAGPDVLAQHVDVPISPLCTYATVCDLLGIAKPSHIWPDSLVDTLTAGAPVATPYALSTKTTEKPNGGWRHARRVTTQKWAFVTHGTGQQELYDRVNDPHEHVNLAFFRPLYGPIQDAIDMLSEMLPPRKDFADPA